MSFKVTNGDVTVEGDFSQLEKLVSELSKNFSVDVGVLGGDGTTPRGNNTLAGIGAEHEFGVPTRKPPLPRRSFIRFPISSGQQQIENDVGNRYQRHMEEGNIKGVFQDIGFACERRIKEAFETGGFGQWKELSEVTKMRKGSDTILVDTGILRDSITSKVNE